jgi:hypothetical protein
MGGTNTVAPLFGTTVPKFFPALLVFLVVFSLLGLDQKLLKFFGIEYFTDKDHQD